MRGCCKIAGTLLLCITFFAGTLSSAPPADKENTPNSELAATLEMLDFYLLAQDPVALSLRRIRNAESGLSMTGADEKTLARDLAVIFSEIRKSSPLLADKLDAMPREELLKKILAALDAGVTIIDASSVKAERPPVKRFTVTRRLSGGRILYIRVDSLEIPQSDTLKVYLGRERAAADTLSGIVLDLRNSGGDDFPEVDAFEKLFLSKEFASLPKIILTSGRTDGAAELLAARLVRSAKGLIAGERGSGRIFPVAEVRAGVFTLEVPLLDEATAMLSPADYNVHIETPALPQINFAHLYDANMGSLSKLDPCLSKALDLVIAISGSKKIYSE